MRKAALALGFVASLASGCALRGPANGRYVYPGDGKHEAADCMVGNRYEIKAALCRYPNGEVTAANNGSLFYYVYTNENGMLSPRYVSDSDKDDQTEKMRRIHNSSVKLATQKGYRMEK
ncbi:MAG: hypothetical protein HY517_05045, partial [Candidatus Aenigmarchaeota archaeon]|nr:hypothetical protein [Candidatus Aenigmarchaeota archaeon]